MTEDNSRGPLGTSDADPCRACPWRDTNRGKRHPDGWYTARNLTRLWQGLRHGAAMSCHPTDPDIEVSEAAQAAGYLPPAPGTVPVECRGAAILQQREMTLLMDDHDYDVRAYRAARPRGLTRDGIRNLAMRLALGGVPLIGGRPMGRPNLNAEVGYAPLPWTPRKADEGGREP